MIEFIDYEKRLTCEEHIVLLYYSLMYKKKHANYSEILYLIFDYPHKHYTFKHFEI